LSFKALTLTNIIILLSLSSL